MNAFKLKKIKEQATNYYGKRIVSQIIFAKELCIYNSLDETDLKSCLDFVEKSLEEEGAITQSICNQAEKMLAKYSPYAKKLTALMVAHAHIDMNWLWGYNETVNITLSTCRTMLELMKEYSGFTFSQSQASVYKIIEEHDPEMLDEIRERVKEGRWEISSSTWVENDKNMPNGQSQVKQYTQAKEYLSNLFGLDKDYFCIDFEPDTFGHNENQPEISRKCGVKYYYHCRGNNAPALYNWKSPSGSSVLVYREPSWYNWTIEYDAFLGMPRLSSEYGINKLLKVYGVGDHGGGATRRDLDRIIDMATWPIMPNVKFSSYHEFFSQFDPDNNKYTTFEGEINYVFSGCYTSQTRIKRSNRKGEKQLKNIAELGSLSRYLKTAEINVSKIDDAWEVQLFNHFHDIIPGSGVLETEEYALGQSQKRDALVGVEKTRLLSKLAKAINTSSLGVNEKVESMSFGAGVGFTTQQQIYSCGARSEKEKIFLVYNPTENSDIQVAQLTLWDFTAEPEEIKAYDSKGNQLETQIVDMNLMDYWEHKFRRILVGVKVAAKGYECVVIKRETEYAKIYFPPYYERQESIEPFVLENDFIRVEINRHSGAIDSLFDKKAKKNLLNGIGCFAFIKEDVAQGMNAWKIGCHLEETELTSNVSYVVGSYKKCPITQEISFKTTFGKSELRFNYALNKYSPILEIHAECDFMEMGNKTFVPALEYRLHTDTSKGAKYGVPFGVVTRAEVDDDQVGNKFACTVGENSIAIATDSKYGYRANNGKFSVNLIRSTTDPSLAPENYRHTFKIGVFSSCGLDESRLIEVSDTFDNTVEVIETDFHDGSLDADMDWVQFGGKARISHINALSNGKIGIVAYGVNNGKNDFVARFNKPISHATVCDFFEKELYGVEIKNNTISLELNKGEIVLIAVEFANN